MRMSSETETKAKRVWVKLRGDLGGGLLSGCGRLKGKKSKNSLKGSPGGLRMESHEERSCCGANRSSADFLWRPEMDPVRFQRRAFFHGRMQAIEWT
jgi:hypothetical protein